MTAGYSLPDFFEVDPDTGNTVSFSLNDTGLTNYQVVTSGAYTYADIDSDGNGTLSGDIPEGFVDTIEYKASWTEYVGSIEEGTCNEITHWVYETVTLVRLNVADPWKINDVDNTESGTTFTVTGKGVPNESATLKLYKGHRGAAGRHKFTTFIEEVDVDVDANGDWSVEVTAPTVNVRTAYQYQLQYDFNGAAKKKMDGFYVDP